MRLLFSLPEFLLVLGGVSTGATLAAWAGSLLLRRKSAALRHFLWLLALCAPLIALPLWALHARVELPLLPPVKNAAMQTTGATASSPSESSTPHVGLDKTSALSASAPLVRGEPIRPAWPVNFWLIAWFIAAAFFVTQLILLRRRISQWLSACSVAPFSLLQLLRRVIARLGFTRPVRMLVTSREEIPFCHGVFRPTVIFPESCKDWPEDRVAICLTHELAHIRRGDLFAMMVGHAACILCWFNPLVWMAAARLREEAENAVDDLVLAKDIEPETYAANLLAITENYRPAVLSPNTALSLAMGMARPNHLKKRIEAIFDTDLPREELGFVRIITIGFLAAIILGAAMTVRLTAAPLPVTIPVQDLKNLSENQSWEMKDSAAKAIEIGDAKSLEFLLQRGLDVNSQLVSHDSFLDAAADANQPAIVTLLLTWGATNSKNTALRQACWKGHKEIADLLIKAGAPAEHHLYAAGMGDMAALEALDREKLLTTEQAREAISFAIASGHKNTFDWLWNRLQSLDENQKATLLTELYECAIKWDQPGALPRLKNLGAHVSPTRLSLKLQEAAGEGKADLAMLLIYHGADINMKDEQGRTALSRAVTNGRKDMCLLLLKHGASASLEDSSTASEL